MRKLVLAAVTLVAASSAHAADFKLGTEANTVSMIGEIADGDAQRLVDLLLANLKLQKLILNSEGGSVGEGFKLAMVVKQTSMDTLVPADASCLSSCVAVFAGGAMRLAYTTSRIGVHSAWRKDDDGKSTEKGAEGGTVATARFLAALKAPASIVAKVVTTEADDMTMLSLDDLREWNVRILDDGKVPAVTVQPLPQLAPETPERYASLPPSSPVYTPPPPPPAPLPPGQQVYDWVLASEGTPMRSFSEFVGRSWDGKIEYMKSIGARWTKDCGGGSCYFKGNVLSQNGMVEYSIRAKPSEFRSFCVHNWRNGRGGCINQDTGDVVLLNRLGNRWIKAS